MRQPDFNNPTLTWSHSRDEILSECKRRYFYRYYGAWGGWRSDASASARQAYRLTQLTTLDQVLGVSVHTRAREICAAVVHRRPRPALSLLQQRTRDDLNRICRNSRDMRAFLRNPKRHPVLLSAYYDRGLGAETIERIRDKAERCLRHLDASPAWDSLAGCRPDQIQVFDEPGHFAMEETLVWAAPDLAYTGQDGRTVVLDWKTGRVDAGTALAQLCLYACFLRESQATETSSAGWVGQLVQLSTGEIWSADLSDAELAAAEGRVRTSLQAMRELLEPDGRTPKPLDLFPLKRCRGRCPECAYWELCEPEIRGRAEESRA